MKKISNMKISKKLFLGFGIIILLLAISSVVSVINLNEVDGKYNDLLSAEVQRYSLSSNTKGEFTNMRRIAMGIVYYTGETQMVEGIYREFRESLNQINKYIDEYIKVVENDSKLEDKEKRMNDLNDLKAIINQSYVKSVDEIYELAKTSPSIPPEVVEESTPTAAAITNVLNDGVKRALQEMEEVSADTTNFTYKQTITLIVLCVIIILLSIFIAVSIANIIKKPIVSIEDAMNEIADGNLNVSIRSNNKDEIGNLSNRIGDVIDIFNNLLVEIKTVTSKFDEGKIRDEINIESFKGDYKEVAIAVNHLKNGFLGDTLDILQGLKSLSVGDFSNRFKDRPGERAEINTSFYIVQDTLNAIDKDIHLLINAVAVGDLSQRADNSVYEGGWEEIVSGLNSLIVTVSEPIYEVSNALTQVSKANLNVSIDSNFAGEFGEMKDAVNATVQNTSSYINEISNILKRMSDQDLDITIDREYNGDFKQIKTALDHIIDTFNILIKSIESSTIQFTDGAKQVADSSMELAQISTEQSSLTEEISSSISTISEQTLNNTNNARKASELAFSTKSNGDKGAEEMVRMLDSMKGIDESSKNIGKIIKVIEDIAFQTNILSLNAAVEAARAGEHGKGFSVVAEEVRTLAARSAAAAKETNDLIRDSIEKAEEGTVIVNNAAEAFNLMVEQVEEIAEIIQEVSYASNDQNEAIKQINIGVDNLVSSAQTNTANSEETASSSQELSSQSEVLRNSIAGFKLKGMY